LLRCPSFIWTLANPCTSFPNQRYCLLQTNRTLRSNRHCSRLVLIDHCSAYCGFNMVLLPEVTKRRFPAESSNKRTAQPHNDAYFKPFQTFKCAGLYYENEAGYSYPPADFFEIANRNLCLKRVPPLADSEISVIEPCRLRHRAFDNLAISGAGTPKTTFLVSR
jgi:hypothetical protein